MVGRLRGLDHRGCDSSSMSAFSELSVIIDFLTVVERSQCSVPAVDYLLRVDCNLLLITLILLNLLLDLICVVEEFVPLRLPRLNGG